MLASWFNQGLPLFSISFSTTMLVTICSRSVSWLQERLSTCCDCRSDSHSAPDNGRTPDNFRINFWMSERKWKWSEKMSRAKRKTVSSDCPPAKWGVTIKSVNKWIVENDKQLDTTTWLCYEKADQEHMLSLKCSICIQFQEKLLSQKNYNSAFITGLKNLNIVIQGSCG